MFILCIGKDGLGQAKMKHDMTQHEASTVRHEHEIVGLAHFWKNMTRHDPTRQNTLYWVKLGLDMTPPDTRVHELVSCLRHPFEIFNMARPDTKQVCLVWGRPVYAQGTLARYKTQWAWYEAQPGLTHIHLYTLTSVKVKVLLPLNFLARSYNYYLQFYFLGVTIPFLNFYTHSL